MYISFFIFEFYKDVRGRHSGPLSLSYVSPAVTPIALMSSSTTFHKSPFGSFSSPFYWCIHLKNFLSSILSPPFLAVPSLPGFRYFFRLSSRLFLYLFMCIYIQTYISMYIYVLYVYFLIYCF